MSEALKHTLLAVDDTKMNRNLISRIFKGKYNVLTAENGIQAMAVLRRERVDVIVLDILMPEMDGFEVIQAVRADEALKQIPIIITTAEREQFERRALQLGADDFVTKPFDPVVVEKRVDNITQRYVLEMEKMQRLLREHEERAEALKRKAEEDGLTKIYNRMGFRSNVTELLQRGTKESALMIIDIDEFKAVNDRYGHPVGDALLQRLAAYFESATRPEDVVGRIGGDEFAVFLCSAGSRQSVTRKANAFIRQAARIRRELGLIENYSISIGVVYSESSEKELETLYRIADNALYLAKKNGKSCAAMLERLETDSGAYIDLSCSPTLFSVGDANQPSIIESQSEYGAILVLDSSDISRNALRLVLKKKYLVFEAANGNLAIEMLSSVSDTIYLVILRVHDTNGGESAFMRLLTQNETLADIPVIAIADELTERGEKELYSLGVVGVLKNESSQDVVLQCVELVMRKRAQELRRRKQRVYSEQGRQRKPMCDMDVFRLEQRESDGKLSFDSRFEEYLWGDWSRFDFCDPSGIYAYTFQSDIPRLAEFLTLGQKTGYAVAEIRFIAASGGFEWFQLRCSRRIEQETGEASMVLTFINMNREIAAREELEKQSNSVMLTHLPNVNSLTESITRLFQTEPNEGFFIILFDIERFRLINELFGAHEGDNILRYIAAKLKEYMDTPEIKGCCGHIYSDVFAVCLAKRAMAEGFIEFIRAALASYPLRFCITPVFGVCEAEDKTSVGELLSRAKTAKDTVKGNPSEHIAYYDSELRCTDTRDKECLLDVQEALQCGDFTPFLQPCCNIETGEIVGAEALARWYHDEHGLMLPESFIPMFGRNGLASEVDRYILRSVCEFIQSRHMRGLKTQVISLNLSRMDIYDPKHIDEIEAAIETFGVSSDELAFEVNERLFVYDRPALIQALRELRQRRFAVLVDGFDGDMGLLSVLRDCGVETIKLDMRLMCKTKTDEGTREVVRHVAELSRTLGLKLVAVGVETGEQAEFLKSVSLSLAQGFYYYKPMSIYEYEHNS